MKIIPIIFTIIILSSCSQDNQRFNLCGLGLTKPYYYTGLKYSGEIFRIEKEIKANYESVSYNNNGIAKVRFKVDCKGKIGDLKYEEFDMNYNKVQLNDSIELQIMNGVSKLNKWIPGKDDNGNPVNSHSFLSFRIIDGEIIEILPK